MNRMIILAMATMLMVGCLKTRAELDEEDSAQSQEHQTVAQQKAAAKPPPPPPDRFEEYDEEMRVLTGRVGNVENSLNQLQTASKADKELSAKDKQSYDREFLAFEEAVKRLEAQIATMSDDIAHLKAPPPAPPAAAPAKGKTPYDESQDLFNAKKWKEAIVGYQKYRDQNPKGKMYADSTYKIGVCFQELGMKDEAKAFLEEVTTKFPNSKEAKKAAFRLKSLK